MKNLNKVQLLGHIGDLSNATSVTTPAGMFIFSFSMATNARWTNDKGTHEATTWHNLVAFDKVAENIQMMLKKGSKIYIEGRIQNSVYKNAKSENVYRSEVVVNDFIMLDAAK